VIEAQTISFGPGLNVITGETGAGKSVVLSALDLILGGRPKSHAVRHGADSLEVEALFDLTAISPEVVADLPDCARGDELIVTRTVATSGRGKVYINGRLGTVSLLEEIVSRIVNICGQSHHIRLLDPQYHRSLLDDFAKNNELLVSYRSHFDIWRESARELLEFEARTERLRQRREELEYTVGELSGLSLYAGVREELESLVRRYGASERVISGTKAVESFLCDEGGVTSQLHRASQLMAELVRLDAGLAPLAHQLAEVGGQVREIARDIAGYPESVDLDEESVAALRDRLAEIARLERKYRTNDAGLVQRLESATAELNELSAVGTFHQLREVERQQYALCEGLAATISERRSEASRELSRLVAAELAEVNMKSAQLSVASTREDPLGPHGAESLEFLLAPNRGEAVRPLRQIASGGELSRIMLVLKKVLRDRSGVNVLVFDEVDTGISGSVARAVGLKLRSLAEESQVLCVTHLPQVASLADVHILVDKIESDRTRSVVRSLTAAERVQEIARMLAGERITEAACESARELLKAV
jgi:DNA repair protein RecN (Recombination protein N)